MLDPRCSARNTLVVSVAELRSALVSGERGTIVALTHGLASMADRSLDGLVLPEWLTKVPEGEPLSHALYDLATSGDSPFDAGDHEDITVVESLLERVVAQWEPDRSVMDGRQALAVAQPGGCLSLAADLTVASSGRTIVRDFGPVSEAAVEAARKVAVNLLTALGYSPKLGVDLSLTGGPFGIQLNDSRLALPVALGILANFVNWSKSGVDILSAGELDDNRQFSPLPDVEVRRYCEAASDLGRNLLVPTKRGWALYGPARGDLELIKEVSTDDHSLEATAKVLWGDDWEPWASAKRANVLERLRFHSVDFDNDDPGQPVPDTHVDQVTRLVNIFTAKPGARVVLGGPAGTGKSTCARLLARSLAEKGWRVVGVSPGSGRFPDEDLLGQVANTVLTGGSPQPTLLVLEDINPVEETVDSDVDTLLAALNDRVHVSILAVLRYDLRATAWKTDETSVVHSITGQNNVREFASVLVQGNPELLANARPYLVELSRRYYRDLRRLTAAMVAVARPGYRGNYDRDLADLLADMNADEREALQKLAAMSLLNGDLPLTALYPLSAESVESAGGVKSTRRRGWRLASADLSRDILRRLHPDAENLTDEALGRYAVELVSLELTNMMKQHPAHVVEFLVGARHADESLCRRLLDHVRFTTEFPAWLAQVDALTTAELVVEVGRMMSDDLHEKLAEALIAGAQGLTSATVGQMELVLRALWKIHASVREKELFECLGAMMGELTRLFESVGENQYRGAHRLLPLLLRFHYEGFNSLVAKHGRCVLQGLNPDIVRDYGVAREVHHAVVRAGRLADVPVPPMSEEHSVRALLDRRVPARRGLPLILAWMTLKLSLDNVPDWDQLLREHGQDIVSSISNTDVQELRYALAELHKCDPAFCVRLLNNVPQLDARLRTLIGKNALVIEAALLLQTLSNLHVRLAFDVLYQPGIGRDDRVPRGTLATELAKRIKDTGDVKGAGMLLTAAYQLDDWRGDPAKGFAHVLAEKIGEEWFLWHAEHDSRSSVISHLVRGMWKARTSFADTVLDTAVTLTAGSIRSTLRQWGPYLALSIIDDPSVAPDFLERLRPEVRPARLLEGMTNAGSVDARIFFHRLGRILHEEVTSEFARTYQDEDVLPRGPIGNALKCVSEVIRTLRAAGADAAEKTIFKQVRTLKGEVRFQSQLRSYMPPTELAEAIRLMRRLDPEYTEQTVTKLFNRRRRSASFGEERVLVERVRYGMAFEESGAANLVAAVQLAAPPLGHELLASVLTDGPAWRRFTLEVQHMQNPTQQWSVARHLHLAGLRFGQPHTSWMAQVFESRYKTMPSLRGPRFVNEVLRMLRLWNDDWARQAAERVNASRIRDRIRNLLPGDVESLPGLVNTLFVCGADEAAGDIADLIEGLDPDRLVKRLRLQAASNLLMSLVAHHVSHEEFAVALGKATGRAIGSLAIRDQAEHWTEIGWAAAALRRVGMTDQIPCVAPPTVPNRALLAEVAWAMSTLPSQAWTRPHLTRTLDILARRMPCTATEAFYTLMAASTAQRTREFITNPDDWGVIAKLGVLQLEELQSISGRDQWVAGALRRHHTAISERLEDRLVSLDERVGNVENWFIEQGLDEIN
jgi:hypothetical protein